MERSSMIDMSLDDIIEITKASRKRPRTSVSLGLLGPPGVPRPPSHFPFSAAPYPYPPPPPVAPMLLPTPPPLSGWDIGEGTKLYVSNLDYDASNEDLKLLFSDVGPLKRYGIHYDRAGQSMGTADVVFLHPEDAIAALKRYNSSRLDGKPLKIELIGATACVAEPDRALTGFKNVESEMCNVVEMTFLSRWQRPPMTTTKGHDCIIGRGPSQHGNAQRRSENVKPTAEALDADLERHRSKAKKASIIAEGS